ncbi:MAG: phospho-N-acetylmuramoyl-pentapeptide-transferase [Rickettsiales bacterium]|jgi:phospho-N-acetylmuramoyl-pentapeptide-transferase|nr:phospho-N-acetylmuramoyl-pentapeptide-transferase [Rickettsiales bacterium]
MFFSLLYKNSLTFSFAFATAFILTLILGKILIPWLKEWQRRGQPIRTDGVASHMEKQGTPTMGGLIFIPAILASSLLFMDWGNMVSWIPLIALVGFGFLGFVDDFYKVTRGNSYSGLTARGRLFAGGVLAIALAFMIDATMPVGLPPLSVVLPFGIILPLGIFYFAWSYLVIVGTANAANLTDGLDGVLVKIYLGPMAAMTVALIGVTRTGFMPNLLFMPETAALFPLFGALFGALLAFLWFNAKPAAVFSGDVGSLALGGFLGASALLIKAEIIMGVAAFMMVIILTTAFIQMMYYRFSGTKANPPFLMAPLHHHLEMKGWAETKITDRFFIASIIFSGLAVALLKL